MPKFNKIIIFSFLLLILVVSRKVINCEDESEKNHPGIHKSNKKILQIKSIPGYPGTRSDLYEIIMEPYLFYIGKKGVAELKSYSDKEILNGAEGKVNFQQLPEGLRINGTINGLSDGLYRLHIHEKGLLSKGCKSTGVNYNPYKISEGQDSIMDPLKDTGDLGDVEVLDKSGKIHLLSKYLTLTGATGVIGRTVVLEKKQQADQTFTLCGIIGIA